MALRVGQLEERFGVWDLVPDYAPTRTLALDYETYSDIDLKKHGLDLYSIHPSCEVLMAAYSIDGGPVQHWDVTSGDKMPRDLRDALRDPDFEIWAFNAQFERVITNRVLDIWPDIHRWRCTMVLSYMHSFTGDLGMVARQMGIDQDKTKLATGKRLINLFTKPQKVTTNQPHRRFNSRTHPIEWKMFVEYNIRDVEAEMEIKRKLHKKRYPIPAREWEFYALDQIINDRGLPIDRIFVENALEMANARKKELLAQMREKTGLQNPGSRDQLLPWLKKRGYPFDDLQKDSIKKVLTAWKGIQSGELKREKNELYPEDLTRRAVAVLKLRQQQARPGAQQRLHHCRSHRPLRARASAKAGAGLSAGDVARVGDLRRPLASRRRRSAGALGRPAKLAVSAADPAVHSRRWSRGGHRQASAASAARRARLRSAGSLFRSCAASTRGDHE